MRKVSITHVPSAIALRQRPPVPGRHSTVGTLTQTYNLVRLLYARVGEHRCPNGHRSTLTLAEVGTGTTDEYGRQTCPVCQAYFQMPTAESFSFDSPLGACPSCKGLGTVDEIDERALVPRRIAEPRRRGVASWKLPGRREMPLVAAQLGVRANIPFARLTKREKRIVLDGPPEKREIAVPTETGRVFKLNMTYVNARQSVAEAGDSAAAARFTSTHTCPACHGARLAPEPLTTLLEGRTIAETCAMNLADPHASADELPGKLPADLKDLTADLTGRLLDGVRPLLGLGLDYLALNRSGPSLSTGERQRIQQAATVHAGSTGALYVPDEPSIGLHPANLDGLLRALDRLADGGNTVLVVDHDLEIMRAAEHLIEIGPGAGRDGGRLDATGTVDDLAANPTRSPAPASPAPHPRRCTPRPVDDSTPHIRLHVDHLHNLHDLGAAFPMGRLTLVTGVPDPASPPRSSTVSPPPSKPNSAAARCPSTSATSPPTTHSPHCPSSVPPRSAPTHGPRRPHAPAHSMRCASCAQPPRRPSGAAGARATSPITPGSRGRLPAGRAAGGGRYSGRRSAPRLRRRSGSVRRRWSGRPG
ncbi:hypothetical protein [Streptomyces sp. NPDC018059]|uniref:hypothetical protein n=1 Tax=Streptomyces sp. NPDC018059 TaxID=3365041 RepID=UPI0037891481